MRRISFVLALIALLVFCLSACEKYDPMASKSNGNSTENSVTSDESQNGEQGTAPAETEYIWTERF